MVAQLNTYSERLESALKEARIDVAGFARAMGLSYQAVKKALVGGKFGAANNLKAARLLNVRSEWLATGEMPRTNQHTGLLPVATDELPEYAGRPKATRRVPIVGTARMGDQGYYEEISGIPGAGDGHLEVSSDDPEAYVLKVRGGSMHPAIRDGWYVLIEPHGRCVYGEPVLVKLKSGRKMVKEFLFERADSIEIESVNGGERMTIYRADLESMQPVAGIFPPSKWKPELE